jgi:hypothetical protein
LNLPATVLYWAKLPKPKNRNRTVRVVFCSHPRATNER